MHRCEHRSERWQDETYRVSESHQGGFRSQNSHLKRQPQPFSELPFRLLQKSKSVRAPSRVLRSQTVLQQSMPSVRFHSWQSPANRNMPPAAGRSHPGQARSGLLHRVRQNRCHLELRKCRIARIGFRQPDVATGMYQGRCKPKSWLPALPVSGRPPNQRELRRPFCFSPGSQ